MKPDFKKEQAWWEGKAAGEERDLADEAINRALRWREIRRNLKGVKTIAEIGAASGAFTIPLARQGFKVTHVDFSAPALELARKKAKGLKNIEFVQANATELGVFKNKSFDLVLNMDGAISFCGKDADKAIKETCRICRRKLVVTVSNKAWMVPAWISATLLKFKKTVPAVESMIKNGFWHYGQHAHNKKIVPGYFGTLQAFLPSELAAAIAKRGFKVQACRGLGSLANLLGVDFVDSVKKNKKVLETFLDLCEDFDRDIMPGGPGTKQRAGLLAVAERH